MRSELPSWKRLTSCTLTTNERVSLITTIFTDHIQVDMVGNLSGDDAQAFINMIDGVRPFFIQGTGRLVLIYSLCIPFVRH